MMVTQPQDERSVTSTGSQLTTGNRARGANANGAGRDNRLLIKEEDEISYTKNEMAKSLYQ